MRRRDNAGITALMDVAKLTGPPEAWHLGFLLGPRINAGGRIGRADLGARLLMSDDPSETRDSRSNSTGSIRNGVPSSKTAWRKPKRKRSPRSGWKKRAWLSSPPQEGWHPGVVGLIAARLRERFGRPAFAIALEKGGTGTGSGRSDPGRRSRRCRSPRRARGIADERRRPRDGGRRYHQARPSCQNSALFSKRRCASRSPRRAAKTLC